MVNERHSKLGLQAYWGGQCKSVFPPYYCCMLNINRVAIKIILGALIGPKFIGMRNTLPLSAHVDTSSLLSFFVFMAIFGMLSWLSASKKSNQVTVPSLLITPEKLQLPLKVML